MLLPKKVGSFTLMRRLDGGRSSEAYVAILEEPAGKAGRRPTCRAATIARDPDAAGLHRGPHSGSDDGASSRPSFPSSMSVAVDE